jgi:hypothetical protein
MPDQVTFLTIDPSEAKPEGFPDTGLQSGTEWMKFAQPVYREILKFIEDDDWANKPVGELAVHWNAARGQSATRLINLALTLNQLLIHVAPDSRHLLKPKIKALFRGEEMVFEENLVELEVGAVLAVNFKPIKLEPLVPPEQQAAHDKPPSPDYGIELPEGVVLIDATVWHWENLSAWHRMRIEIERKVFSQVDKRKVFRDVLLHLPIKPSKNAQEIIASRDMCSRVADCESGEEVLDVGASRPARICWTTTELPFDWNTTKVPKFSEAPVDPALVVKSHPYVIATTKLPGPPQFGYLHFTTELCLTEDDVQDGLNSLRKSIDVKKRQGRARPDLPYLLAVHLYSDSASWDDFAPMLIERLWPNDRYQWLSGILAHDPEPARLTSPSASTLSLFPVPNPNATVPMPESMLNSTEPPQQPSDTASGP